MTYSILVMAYDPEDKLAEMTARCVNSVLANTKKKEYELFVDFGTDGVEKKVNRFFARATGTYLIFLNNDSVIEDPEWLEKLCIDGCLTSFTIGEFFLDNEREPNFGLCCIPRTIQEKIGLFDERFNEGYGFSDSDYARRCRLAGVPFNQVDVDFTHLGGATWEAYFKDRKDSDIERNRALFIEKWA